MNKALAIPATQPTLEPGLTLALAQASIAAYADYNGQPVVPPANYTLVARWTGWDAVLFGGVVEKFGLLFQSTQQADTFIFAFRGTDSDMDIYEDGHFETTEFVPTKGGITPTPHVAAGFYGIYDGIGGAMTQSMREQLFALLAQYKPGQLYVTGHSLGAALSQLFSLDIAISRPTPAININFASPMVGTAGWQAAYDAAIPADSSIRCYNYWDYVPSLPPSDILGYTAVGSGFRTAFFVRSEWFVHELPRHSIANLRTVLQHALYLTPQSWVGTFPDYVEPSRTMQSERPPTHADVNWGDKARELKAFEQAVRNAA